MQNQFLILHIFLCLGENRKRGEGMKREIVYIKLERDVKVKNHQVTLRDIAGVSSNDATLTAKIKNIFLFRIKEDKSKREIVSIVKVVDAILKAYPDLSVQSIGEMECIVEYVGDKKRNKLWDALKVFFVCLIVFFGAGFSIMTFNEDVSVNDIFQKLYNYVLGSAPNQPGILEFTYSLGLGLGIIVFYGHIGGRRITKDPTPLEVQMRVYEKDVNDALVETAARKGELIDVD